MNKRTGVGASNDKLNTNVYIGYKHQHSLRIESRGTVTHIAPPSTYTRNPQCVSRRTGEVL